MRLASVCRDSAVREAVLCVLLDATLLAALFFLIWSFPSCVSRLPPDHGPVLSALAVASQDQFFCFVGSLLFFIVVVGVLTAFLIRSLAIDVVAGIRRLLRLASGVSGRGRTDVGAAAE